MTRPNFAVAADETPYRRLGAVIREEIYRLQQSSYTSGVQSESGLINLARTQEVLAVQRDRIYSKIESLLMLVDQMAEMKDVNVTSKGEGLRPERRSRAKVKPIETTDAPQPPIISIEDPVTDAAAQDLVDRVLAGLDTRGES